MAVGFLLLLAYPKILHGIWRGKLNGGVCDSDGIPSHTRDTFLSVIKDVPGHNYRISDFVDLAMHDFSFVYLIEFVNIFMFLPM